MRNRLFVGFSVEAIVTVRLKSADYIIAWYVRQMKALLTVLFLAQTMNDFAEL